MTKHIFETHPIPAAGLLGLATIPFHLLLSETASYFLAAGILSLIAGIYVGFAVIDGRMSRMLLEGAVALAFTVFAMFTLSTAPVWLVAGYFAHGVWDAIHHSPLFDTQFPRWYIPACAIYDLIVGAAIWIIWLV